MSSTSTFDTKTRSMLDMTLQNITQLDSTLQYHLEQERAILLEIESLECKLREKKQQHVQLTSNITTIRRSIANMKDVEKNLQSALSPIKRLPDEVLLHIFRTIVQEDDCTRDERAGMWKTSNKTGRLLHWRLRGVCARWRKVMRDNASLWTTVDVHLKQPSDEFRDRERQRLSNYIKLGKSSEQTLIIGDWTPARDGFLRTVLSGPAQWKAVHIMPIEDSNEGHWDVGNISTRNLRLYRAGLKTCVYFIPLMRQASVLVLYGQSPEWGGLPWIHLRSLTLKNYAANTKVQMPTLSFGLAELTALLVAATELTGLVLDFPIDEATLMNEASTTITHRNLACLSLHLHHFVGGKGPFSVTLNAPSLQTLDFISLRCKSSSDPSFLCHWDDPKTLSLPTLDDQEVLLAVELTKWLPNVNSLCVTGDNVDALFTFFHSLFHHIPPRSPPLPLPKLGSLFIKDTDLRGETLIELLESRLRQVRGNTAGVCAIADIKMYNSPAVTFSHWRRVQELLLEGDRSGDVFMDGDMDQSAGGQ